MEAALQGMIKELEAAILIVSEDVSAGSCVVQLGMGVSLKFETIGRDDDGGFLVTDQGDVIRLLADKDELDDLLDKEVVYIDELDEFGTFVGSYPVTAVPFGMTGFRA